MAFQVVQWQRIHLPMQETQETRVQSLGRDDSLEKEMTTHSSILAEIIPRTEEQKNLAGYSPWGHKESDTTEQLNTHTHTHYINCSCLVAQSDSLRPPWTLARQVPSDRT